MKTKFHDFGSGCPKCRAAAGVRSHCLGCKALKDGSDHHHCACTSCGFAWVEKPADAMKATKGGKKR